MHADPSTATSPSASPHNILDHLTGDDWQRLTDQVSDLRGRDLIPMEELRTLINNWIVTAMLRGNPDFVRNVDRNRAAQRPGEVVPRTRARDEGAARIQPVTTFQGRHAWLPWSLQNVVEPFLARHPEHRAAVDWHSITSPTIPTG